MYSLVRVCCSRKAIYTRLYWPAQPCPPFCRYMDGAITDYVPLQGALTLDAAAIVAIDAGELCTRSEPPANIPEIIVSTMHAAIRQRVHAEAPAVAEKVPLLYLPTPCAQDHNFLDFRDSSRLMDEAEALAIDFLAEADVPEAGKMSGAPHTHDHQPGEIARTAVAGES